jgi:hypothetical protein
MVFFVLGHLSPFFCLIQRYAVLMRVREKIYVEQLHAVITSGLLLCMLSLC